MLTNLTRSHFSGRFPARAGKRPDEALFGVVSQHVPANVPTSDGLVADGSIERQTPVDHDDLTGHIPRVG